jgi:hypothetical protein
MLPFAATAIHIATSRHFAIVAVVATGAYPLVISAALLNISIYRFGRKHPAESPVSVSEAEILPTLT